MTANYVIDIFSVTTYVIPANVLSFEVNDTFNTLYIPDIAVIGILGQNNYEGAYDNSIFQFDNNHLKDIYLIHNSFRIPSIPFNGSENDNIIPWSMLYQDNWSNQGLYIDRKRYKKGYQLYYFDMLHLDSMCNDILKPKTIGSVKLRVQFAANHEVLQCVIFSRRKEVVGLTNSRSVVMNFNF